MHPRLTRYRPVALVLLALQLQACAGTRWEPVSVGPRQLLEEEKPEAIRVTLDEGRQETLRAPYLSGDSILSVQASELVAVPIADIRQLEVGRSGGPQGTGTAVLLGLGVVVFTLGMIYASSPMF